MTEVCPICLDPLTNPVFLPCKHLFCGRPKKCVLFNAYQEGEATKCSVCRVISQREPAEFLNFSAVPEGRELEFLLDLKTHEKCSKEGHKGELLEFMCTSWPCHNCQLCSVCVKEDHSGDNHIVETISDITAAKRRILSQITDNFVHYRNFKMKWQEIDKTRRNIQQLYKDATTEDEKNHLDLEKDLLTLESLSERGKTDIFFGCTINENCMEARIQWQAPHVLSWADSDWNYVLSQAIQFGGFYWRFSATCDTHESIPGIGVNIYCLHPTLAEWSVKAAYDIAVVNQFRPILSKYRSSEESTFDSSNQGFAVFDDEDLEEHGCGESCLVTKDDLLDETKGWVYEEKLTMKIILKLIQWTLSVLFAVEISFVEQGIARCCKAYVDAIILWTLNQEWGAKCHLGLQRMGNSTKHTCMVGDMHLYEHQTYFISEDNEHNNSTRSSNRNRGVQNFCLHVFMYYSITILMLFFSQIRHFHLRIRFYYLPSW